MPAPRPNEISVYIVSGTFAGARRIDRYGMPDALGEFERQDIAKFFTLADANKHVPKLHPRWKDVRITTTTERTVDQHVAHGGTVGQ